MVECEYKTAQNIPTIKSVLIDTWWNVNDDNGTMRKQTVSFNRYMVECELLCPYPVKRQMQVLIDTWWNVNHVLYTEGNKKGEVLIDTWWNVNKNRRIAFCNGHGF